MADLPEELKKALSNIGRDIQEAFSQWSGNITAGEPVSDITWLTQLLLPALSPTPLPYPENPILTFLRTYMLTRGAREAREAAQQRGRWEILLTLLQGAQQNPFILTLLSDPANIDALVEGGFLSRPVGEEIKRMYPTFADVLRSFRGFFGASVPETPSAPQTTSQITFPPQLNVPQSIVPFGIRTPQPLIPAPRLNLPGAAGFVPPGGTPNLWDLVTRVWLGFPLGGIPWVMY